MKMTDKEQIIIDGVNVGGCSYYNPLGNYNCGGTKKCSQWSNCYFKQLARKTQECESLKEEIEVLKDNFDTATRDCNEWLNNFMNFYNWAMANGYRDDLTIERIDVNGDYCPKNCKWISQKEQSKNRRNVHLITFNGKSQSLTDWSNELNINFNTLYQRIIISKWSIEKAFTSPIRSHQAINQRGRVGV